MASIDGVQDNHVVNVQLQWEGDSSDIFMEASEMRQLPSEAMAALKTRAEEMLRGRPLLRLTYVDDDGDHCTLTEGSLHDALIFATPGTEGIWALHVSVRAAPAPAAEPTEVSIREAPAPAAEPTQATPTAAAQLPEPPSEAVEEPTPDLPQTAEPPAPAAVYAEAPAEVPVPAAAAPSLQSLEVHVSVACDACDQLPILGKRFKCLECHDYDLCERCFKRNRTDLSVHGHQTWAQIQSDARVLARVDDEGAAVCHYDIVCDGCNATPLVGSRFKCTSVPNYDLCAECYARRTEVSPHANEPFEEIVFPPTIPIAAPEPPVQAVPASEPSAQSEVRTQPEEFLSLSAVESSSVVPAQGEAEPKPEQFLSLSALEGSSALKALAFHLDDDLCLLALEALMKHPDERLREAAAKAAEAAAAVPPAPESPPLPVPEPEVLLEEADLEATPKPEVAAEEEPTLEEAPMAVEVEEDKEGLKPESVSMVVEEDKAPEAKLSATVLSSSQLVLGVEASENEAARGDVTGEFEEMLQQVPTARQAYRCGHMVLPASDEAGSVPAEAKVVVRNDGVMPWPEATCLTVVAGDALGLASMGLGPLQPGEAAEVIMDLAVPQGPQSGLERSAWSMLDAATGEPFGPLLLFEVARTQM